MQRFIKCKVRNLLNYVTIYRVLLKNARTFVYISCPERNRMENNNLNKMD